MFNFSKSRRPPKSFNLIYLETNEIHFMSLKVSLLIQSTNKQIDGTLHLCTRSIFFEPSNINKPLIRIKYSSGVLLRMMKNIQSKKIDQILTLSKNQNQLKQMLTKGPNQIAQILESKQEKHDLSKNHSLLQKLYEPSVKKIQNEQKQKIMNCFLIKVSKLFIIYRKPISPYITEKTEDNFIFTINKTNHKNKVLRFLKLYDQITKCSDEQKLVRSVINATEQQSKEELVQLHSEQKLETTNIFKCKRVNIEGAQYGQLVLLKNRVRFVPLINSPNLEGLEFTFRQIKFIHKYRYQYEDVGIQIWLHNYPYSLLFVFQDKNIRESIYRQLRISGQKIIKIELMDIVNMWTEGQISNVQYLNFVNLYANRSYNDLSQYPVFPWVFHNWDTDYDLKNYDNFRCLQKPIGAINKHRLRKLKDIYEINVRDKTATNPPHLYPTHYSTPGYISYYLLRKIPEFIVKIQNGVFSPSDRIFRSVQASYYSCMNSVADFKELTPQFYGFESEFLVNSQKLQMGSTPQGDLIDDVILPKWANNSQDFLLKMRAAFESDYVSAHLNQWIDLKFGFKQTGTNAITSENLFYYLTYKQNAGFDRNMSRIEKAALRVQITEFGQCPVQIFDDIHPIKRTRLISLGVSQGGEDKKIVDSKLVALGQQNQRLQQQLQKQRYRFTRKLNEKQQILMKTQKDKKKDSQKLRQLMSIDGISLKNFEYKKSFNNDKQKDVYMMQLEQLLRQKDQQNEKMKLIITGMKRQVENGDQSFDSQVNEQAEIDPDFLEGSN